MTGKVIVFPPGIQDFSLLHSVQVRSETHTAFCSGGTGGFFLGVKGAAQRS